MNINNLDFSNLDKDLRAKAEKCTSVEEFVQFAKENGIDLSDEQLDMITGGFGDVDNPIYSQKSIIPKMP